MGDPKKPRKKYENPLKKWDKAKIEGERKLIENYGLKNKRELRIAETILRKKRQNARSLLALPPEQRKKRENELLKSMASMGLLRGESLLDDVLSLSVTELLERRLQTMVWRKDLAKTVKQARQFIIHGHIAIKGKKVDCPSYLVKAAEEEHIGYFGKPIELEPKKKEAEKHGAMEETKAGTPAAPEQEEELLEKEEGTAANWNAPAENETAELQEEREAEE